MKLDSNLVDTYLWYSYIHKGNAEILNHDFWCSRPVSNSYTVTETAGRFDQIFDQLLNENPSKKHIVPLSGGWDSRAILGALYERINIDEIETVTFGVPGQLDYDIGLKIGKKTGIKFNNLDLRLIDFNWDAVLKSVKISPWTFVPDGLYNQASIDFAGKKNGLVWSGFLGDPLTGSHLNSAVNSADFTDMFVKNQQRCTSLFLPSPDYKPELPGNFDYCNLDFRHDDYLDLVVRQANCIAPLVLFQNIRSLATTSYVYKNDIKLIAPFGEKNWIRYWLDAPESERKEQKLYLEMLYSKFPKLFALPSKQDLGLPRNAQVRNFLVKGKHRLKTNIQKKYPYLRIRSRIKLNYVDYDQMYRRRKDYRETLITAFDYLKSNEISPWLNYDKLWNEHMRYKKDYGDAFNVLVGLAANFKVSEDDANQ